MVPQTTFRSNSGERTTRCSRKNIITYMHRSNNSSPYPLFERLFAVILSVTDIKEITFGGCIAEVIPKNSGTVWDTASISAYSRNEAWICLSDAISRCCLCVGSELSRPGYMRVKILAESMMWPNDIARQFMSKASCDWWTLCRGFSFFWPPKEHDRTTTRGIQDNWLRVKLTSE